MKALVVAALAAIWSGVADAQQGVIVPRVVIYPKQIVSPQALRLADIDADGDVVRSFEEAQGRVSLETLLPGRAIARSALAAPNGVLAGGAVRLVFQMDGVIISTLATALQAGAAGERIRVRNVDSGRVISGRVLADGSVEAAE